MARLDVKLPKLNASPLTCPRCGQFGTVTHTHYGERHGCCDVWSWSASRPMVPRAVHIARNLAHASFDPIWQTGLLTRSGAYRMLARELGISPSECHMAHMDLATASRVPDVANEIRSRLKARDGVTL